MSTQLDAVLLALTTKWQALMTTTLAGVQVVDGPQANSDPSTEWLFVGHDGSIDENDAANATQDLMTFARGKKEDAEIKCAAIVVRGDPNIPAARQRALAILSAAEDALRIDMPVGGLVMHCFVSGYSYIPTQTDKGAKVRIVFTVTYQAQF